MTDREYKIAVGGLIFCWACRDYVESPHPCPLNPSIAWQSGDLDEACDCEACQ